MPRPRVVDGPSEKLTIMVPADLMRTIRIVAAAENRAIAAVVGEVLQAWADQKVKAVRADLPADDIMRVTLAPGRKR